MNKRFAVAAFACFLSSIAQAQTTIEVSKITCEQYNSYKVEDPDKIAIWLSGYYHGLQKNSNLELNQLKDRGAKIKNYCFDHPKSYVMEALKAALKK